MAIPMSEAALPANYNVAVEFDVGYLIAKVKRAKMTDYLYDLYGGLIANPGTFPAGAISNFNIPQDANAPPRRILRHLLPKHIWQVFPTLNHPDARFYLNVPQNQRTKGLENDQGFPRIDFQSNFGWLFEGRDSDIDDPTDAGEFFIPPYDDCEIACVNMANYEIRPQTKFYINQLELEPFDATSDRGRRVINGILKQSIPARFWHRQGTPYPMAAQTFNAAFGVPAIKWDGTSARMVGLDGQERDFTEG